MDHDQAWVAGTILGLMLRELETNAKLRGLKVEPTYEQNGDYAPLILLKRGDDLVLTISVDLP